MREQIHVLDVPFDVVSNAPNIDCISVGKPGYGIVFISTAFNLAPASIFIEFL